MEKIKPDYHFYDNESKGYVWAWSEWAKDQAVIAEQQRVLDVLLEEQRKIDSASQLENMSPSYVMGMSDALTNLRKALFPEGGISP